MSDIEYDDEFYEDEESEFSFEDDSETEVNDENDSGELTNAAETSADETNTINNGHSTYKQWTLQDFIQWEFMNQCVELKQLQLPQCDSQDLLIMLQYYKWQKDDVINNYYDNYNKLMENCGLVESSIRDNKFQSRQNFLCWICCEDYEEVETFCLTCNHEYCKNCYGEYVKSEVPSGRLIRCMDPQCSFVIPHKDVQVLFETVQDKKNQHDEKSNGDQTNNRYLNHDHAPVISFNDKDPLIDNVLLKSAAKIYIEARKFQFKWCPAPDCDTLIENLDYKLGILEREEEEQEQEEDYYDNKDLNEVDREEKGKEWVAEEGNKDKSFKVKKLRKIDDIAKVPIVSCPKDHQFCYGCQYENHLPCPCWVVSHWIKKCQDDSETAHWLEANTHGCPKCQASIEKNGGCNHMTCPTCKYEFCWICLNEWKIHGTDYYKCNKFDPQMKETIELNQRQKRQSLQRYLHYYKRFLVHESSMKGDIKTLDMVNDKMRIFMEGQLKNNKTNLSWIDIQFLQDAFKALTNGRKTLKWAYCFEFYLSNTNYADVFEQVQEYLNKVVEDLSKIFEELNQTKNQNKSTELIMKNKQDIINLTHLVIKRQRTLIDCADSGIKQGLLTLSTNTSVK